MRVVEKNSFSNQKMNRRRSEYVLGKVLVPGDRSVVINPATGRRVKTDSLIGRAVLGLADYLADNPDTHVGTLFATKCPTPGTTWDPATRYCVTTTKNGRQRALRAFQEEWNSRAAGVVVAPVTPDVPRGASRSVSRGASRSVPRRAGSPSTSASRNSGRNAASSDETNALAEELMRLRLESERLRREHAAARAAMNDMSRRHAAELEAAHAHARDLHDAAMDLVAREGALGLAERERDAWKALATRHGLELGANAGNGTWTGSKKRKALDTPAAAAVDPYHAPLPGPNVVNDPRMNLANRHRNKRDGDDRPTPSASRKPKKKTQGGGRLVQPEWVF